MHQIGTAIILRRNIDPLKLCNDNRPLAKKIMNNITKSTILNRKYTETFTLNDSDRNAVQIQIFTVSGAIRLCDDHQQEQSLQVCGLNLNFSKMHFACFLHIRRHVMACSRVVKPSYVLCTCQTK